MTVFPPEERQTLGQGQRDAVTGLPMQRDPGRGAGSPPVVKASPVRERDVSPQAPGVPGTPGTPGGLARPSEDDFTLKPSTSTAASAGGSRRMLRWGLGGGLTLLAVGAVLWSVFALSPSTEQLPEGFPSQAELPLVKGEVVAQTALPGSQRQVTVQVADPAAQLEAVQTLQDEGYRVLGTLGDGPIGTVTSLANDSHAVRVAFDRDASGVHTVTYLTAPIPTEDSSADASG